MSRWVRTAAVAVTVAAQLAGCGGQGSALPSTDGGAAVRVMPFSRVEEGSISVVPDPTAADRAILHVRTTQPMICAVLWGRTGRFGHLDNSSDMAGTGLMRHDVYLPGAQPGVRYQYVVEGFTADGTLYRSPVGVFTLAAAGGVMQPATLPYGADLTRSARVVAVSSEYSPAFAATNAIDGDPTTEWATRGDGNGAFITLDLGAARRIAAVEFVTRSMADGTSITLSYTVTIDGTRTFGPLAAGTPGAPRPSPVDAGGRIVRFQVASSSGGNTGAIEVRVLAPPG